jgi:hypothetical protein
MYHIILFGKYEVDERPHGYLSIDGVDVGRHGDLDRIPLAQDIKEWRGLENTEMNLRVSLRVGYN